jgi:hypothetical protein
VALTKPSVVRRLIGVPFQERDTSLLLSIEKKDM